MNSPGIPPPTYMQPSPINTTLGGPVAYHAPYPQSMPIGMYSTFPQVSHPSFAMMSHNQANPHNRNNMMAIIGMIIIVVLVAVIAVLLVRQIDEKDQNQQKQAPPPPPPRVIVIEDEDKTRKVLKPTTTTTGEKPRGRSILSRFFYAVLTIYVISLIVSYKTEKNTNIGKTGAKFQVVSLMLIMGLTLAGFITGTESVFLPGTVAIILTIATYMGIAFKGSNPELVEKWKNIFFTLPFVSGQKEINAAQGNNNDDKEEEEEENNNG